MIQEDKELLLKDLSARLAYGVICKCLHSNTVKATAIDTEDLSVYYFDCDEWESIEHCNPYLRPMSSMTEEECEEYRKFLFPCPDYNGKVVIGVYHRDLDKVCDWLNKHHFDYRGLIEKGLAIEAPEGMYN